jgi:chromosomal replication initiation ATPase DnaA
MIHEIITEMEEQLLNETGKVYRLSVEFNTPETDQEGITEMCKCWGIKESYLHERNRTPELVMMRQIVMHYLRDMRRYSFPRIGDYFRFDHSTVVYGLNKVKDLKWAKDAMFMELYRKVEHVFR